MSSPGTPRETRTDFPNATLAEIYEQPQALLETIESYTAGGNLDPVRWDPVAALLAGRDRLVIAASGSSRHAGLVGEIMMEELSGIAVDVEYASEYTYRRPDAVLNPAVLVISQSGETADTLAALHAGKNRGAPSLSITNVAGSTMARDADVSLLTCAGKEVAIAATKSFVTQLTILYLMSLLLGRERGRLRPEDLRRHIASLSELPSLMRAWLPRWESTMKTCAADFQSAGAFLYLGRASHYPIAREGALKLKEVSYVHAEAYPSGELKHGPNALLGEGSPLVVIATCDREDPSSVLRYEKSLQLLRDIAGQESHVLAIATEGDEEIRSLCQNCVCVPAVAEYVLPLAEVVPLQLFAYFMSLQRGYDVDRPRNLVKAVTVE